MTQYYFAGLATGLLLSDFIHLALPYTLRITYDGFRWRLRITRKETNDHDKD